MHPGKARRLSFYRVRKQPTLNSRYFNARPTVVKERLKRSSGNADDQLETARIQSELQRRRALSEAANPEAGGPTAIGNRSAPR